MKQKFLDEIRKQVLVYDGSKGVMLQLQGLTGEETSESWNLFHPERVQEVYRLYRAAGSDALQTNTFPGNRHSLDKYGLGDRAYEINHAGVRLAKEIAGDDRFVIASVGPTGALLAPAGDLTFDQVYEAFTDQMRAIAAAGADAVNIETFTDLAELRIAILAARENTRLPVIASVSFDGDNGRKTLSGNPPEVCAIVAQTLGAGMVGANCSSGPDLLVEIIAKMKEVAAVPLVVKPNAGLPEVIDGRVVFKETPDRFVSFAGRFLSDGVRLIGGCCGTTPDFIAALRRQLSEMTIPPYSERNYTALASAFQYLPWGGGNRYPVGRLQVDDEIREALSQGDDYPLFDQIAGLAADGAKLIGLDLEQLPELPDWSGFGANWGLMARTPVVVRAKSPQRLERFLRYYPGVAGVVSGDAPGLREILGKYGGVAVEPRDIESE
jgi:methionine synthase I (cobalamin-dependent)